MSRTIITNSGSDFITNINAENLLGHLCEEAGVKFSTGLFDNTTLAYSMTKEEAIQAGQGLLKLTERVDILYPKYKIYLHKTVGVTGFKHIIEDYAKDFIKSEGYDCVS